MAKNLSAVLDIGSSKLTVLIGAEGVNNSYVIYGKSSVPYAGFSDGEFLEVEKLQNAIGKAIENVEINTKFSIKELCVSIPAEFCVCRTRKITVTFGATKKLNDILIDEIYANAVEYVDGHTHITTEPIYNLLDDGRKLLNVSGQKTTKLTSLVSTIYANNNFIGILNGCLSALGIVKVKYVSSAVAETSYFLPAERLSGSVALLDIGYITSEISIVRGGGLVSLNSFSMGGAHIMADLAECLTLNFKDAEILKRKIVLSWQPTATDIYLLDDIASQKGKGVFAKPANQIVCDRLEVIAHLVKKALEDFSKEEFVPIFLTGGGISCMKGAKEYLSALLGQNISVLSPNLVEFNSPADSSAIALLHYSLKKFGIKHAGMLAKLKKS